MKTIQTIIQRLGYEKSEKLFKLQEINKCNELS